MGGEGGGEGSQAQGTRTQGLQTQGIQTEGSQTRFSSTDGMPANVAQDGAPGSDSNSTASSAVQAEDNNWAANMAASALFAGRGKAHVAPSRASLDSPRPPLEDAPGRKRRKDGPSSTSSSPSIRGLGGSYEDLSSAVGFSTGPGSTRVAHGYTIQDSSSDSGVSGSVSLGRGGAGQVQSEAETEDEGEGGVEGEGGGSSIRRKSIGDAKPGQISAVAQNQGWWRQWGLPGRLTAPGPAARGTSGAPEPTGEPEAEAEAGAVVGGTGAAPGSGGGEGIGSPPNPWVEPLPRPLVSPGASSEGSTGTTSQRERPVHQGYTGQGRANPGRPAEALTLLLVRRVGEGCWGDTWLGRLAGPHRHAEDVAVKILRPSPHVASLWGISSTQDTPLQCGTYSARLVQQAASQPPPPTPSSAPDPSPIFHHPPWAPSPVSSSRPLSPSLVPSPPPRQFWNLAQNWDTPVPPPGASGEGLSAPVRAHGSAAAFPAQTAPPGSTAAGYPPSRGAGDVWGVGGFPEEGLEQLLQLVHRSNRCRGALGPRALELVTFDNRVSAVCRAGGCMMELFFW